MYIEDIHLNIRNAADGPANRKSRRSGESRAARAVAGIDRDRRRRARDRSAGQRSPECVRDAHGRDIGANRPSPRST